MNIFYLDPDPRVCARMHCDKHCVKMILETAQLLCTTHRVLDGDESADSLGLYKAAFKNHPCAVWVRESADNYLYSLSLLINLCEQYEFRYKKIHSTEKLIGPLSKLPLHISLDKSFTEPPQCMPEQYKGDDVVKAYHDYYINEKLSFAKWNYTEAPEWLYV
jgi:hypothetical protein|tara:strand:+ start:657 stop:1142 length:486 start_codon:yes stop_codon:yes gene_type:complete